MSNLSNLLQELELLKGKIQQEIDSKNQTTAVFFNYKNIGKDNKLEDRKVINYDKRHYLLTFTFSPNKIVNLCHIGQKHLLSQVFQEFHSHQYFGCYEMHKSMILHGHMLIQADDYHIIYEKCHKIKKHCTNSRSDRLEPAIKISPVKQTVKDINRSFDYIYDQKKDHPKYKYLEKNV